MFKFQPRKTLKENCGNCSEFIASYHVVTIPFKERRKTRFSFGGDSTISFSKKRVRSLVMEKVAPTIICHDPTKVEINSNHPTKGINVLIPHWLTKKAPTSTFISFIQNKVAFKYNDLLIIQQRNSVFSWICPVSVFLNLKQFFQKWNNAREISPVSSKIAVVPRTFLFGQPFGPCLDHSQPAMNLVDSGENSF